MVRHSARKRYQNPTCISLKLVSRELTRRGGHLSIRLIIRGFSQRLASKFPSIPLGFGGTLGHPPACWTGYSTRKDTIFQRRKSHKLSTDHSTFGPMITLLTDLSMMPDSVNQAHFRGLTMLPCVLGTHLPQHQAYCRTLLGGSHSAA